MLDDNNFPLLRPLGILVSIPVLEVLRHQFSLKFGPVLVDMQNPEKTPSWIPLLLAVSCFNLILVTGSG